MIWRVRMDHCLNAIRTAMIQLNILSFSRITLDWNRFIIHFKNSNKKIYFLNNLYTHTQTHPPPELSSVGFLLQPLRQSAPMATSSPRSATQVSGTGWRRHKYYGPSTDASLLWAIVDPLSVPLHDRKDTILFPCLSPSLCVVLGYSEHLSISG